MNNKKLLTTRNSDSAWEATILCVATPLFLALAGSPNPNRAPIAVFIGLGVALAIVGVVLFFAIPLSGEDYRSGGTNYYSGPFGGFWALWRLRWVLMIAALKEAHDGRETAQRIR